MSGLALRERRRLLDELHQIVSAMRNLAYVELQRLARLRLAGDAAAQAVLQAMADTAGKPPATAPVRVWLVLGAERGFCGGFNDPLLERAASLRQTGAGGYWLLAGDRLGQHADGRFADAIRLPGAGSAEEAAVIVEHWLETLRTLPGDALAGELTVVQHGDSGLLSRRLLPVPALPAPAAGPPPLSYLPAPALDAGLRAAWLRAGLLQALYQSLEQESHWRLGQMQRAQDHLEDAAQQLDRRYFRQRQADITNELETLMSSLEAQASA